MTIMEWHKTTGLEAKPLSDSIDDLYDLICRKKNIRPLSPEGRKLLRELLEITKQSESTHE